MGNVESSEVKKWGIVLVHYDKEMAHKIMVPLDTEFTDDPDTVTAMSLNDLVEMIDNRFMSGADGYLQLPDVASGELALAFVSLRNVLAVNVRESTNFDG